MTRLLPLTGGGCSRTPHRKTQRPIGEPSTEKANKDTSKTSSASFFNEVGGGGPHCCCLIAAASLLLPHCYVPFLLLLLLLLPHCCCFCCCLIGMICLRFFHNMICIICKSHFLYSGFNRMCYTIWKCLKKTEVFAVICFF